MHLCILEFFQIWGFLFLKSFGVFFSPTGTSCFTVLWFPEHPPVHVLNGPSMHGYIWAERQVGHHVCPCLLLNMKTDTGLYVSPLMSQPQRWPRDQMYGQQTPGPSQLPWVLWVFSLTDATSWSASDKNSWSSRHIPLLLGKLKYDAQFPVPVCPSRGGESTIYHVQRWRTVKATEEPLCMLCQCSGQRCISRNAAQLPTRWSVWHTAGTAVTHSNSVPATNSCTFLLKQTPFRGSWTYSR